MKHIFRLVTLLIIIIIGTRTANADTTLKIANAFNIKAVNGALYTSGLINQNKSLRLNAGLNLIALEYEEVFESNYDDNFEIVKSSLFLLKVYLQNNRDYQQRFIKPHDAKAARRYSLNPIFEIISPANQTSLQESVKFELEALASDQESYIIEKTRANPNFMIDLTQPKKQTKANNLDSTSINGHQVMQSTPSKMLEYWWQQASPEERRIFLESHSNAQ